MLKIKGLKKCYECGNNILDGLDIQINEGDFISIVGPSGCGKTTLLNIIGGIEQGEYVEYINDFKRRCIMFQNGGLFPWLNVYENIEFAILNDIEEKEKREEIVDKYLKMMHLTEFKYKRINELSGGMKQRVALSRALAYNSDLIILDEPFSALDSQIKNVLLMQIQKIWKETGKTFVLVTHNVEEAVILSNKIVTLEQSPARVKNTYNIDLARPRTISNKEITDYILEIQKDLREEVFKFVKKEYDNDYNVREDDISHDISSDMEYYL